jgi:dienelactone hydrolase
MAYVKGHSDIGATRVVVYGQSLGGAVALYTADKFRDDVRALRRALFAPYGMLNLKAKPKGSPLFAMAVPGCCGDHRKHLLQCVQNGGQGAQSRVA